MAADLRSVFACPDRPSAERRLKELVTTCATSAPNPAAWLEAALPEGFTVFAFPAALFDRAQGTRTRVASLFPNEASLLSLACALLAEASEDWEASKTYLDMNPSIPPSA